MYGMVNQAIEQMVTAAHGPERWVEIKRRAGVTTEVFIGNEGYDDSTTYALVGAASEVLATPPDVILRAFGEHWVLETARKGYGPLMDAAGRTLGEFLAYLPHFHDRIALIYPKLEPPRFEVSDQAERSLHMHYFSDRPGLMPFVEGLVTGLGKMFGTPATVTALRSRAEGHDHEEFLVRW
jgi:hypothetical protein